MSMRVKINVAGTGPSTPQSREKPTEMMVEKPDNFKLAQLRNEPAVAEIRVLESGDLFAGTNEIMIRHDGVIYRLKITRQGKLILNK
mgnify:CR=1 FL=1